MIFWIFAALLILILIFTILIRNSLAWGWNLAILAIFLYMGLFKMTGLPRDILWFSTIENVHGVVQVVYSTVIDEQGIYLLVQDKPGHIPFYLVLPYDEATAKALQSAKMQAEQQRAPLMADADQLSRRGQKFNSSGDGNGTGNSPAAGHGSSAAGQGSPTGPAPGSGRGRDSKAMFWPLPVQPDPLKNYQQSITTEQGEPTGESPH